MILTETKHRPDRMYKKKLFHSRICRRSGKILALMLAAAYAAASLSGCGLSRSSVSEEETFAQEESSSEEISRVFTAQEESASEETGAEAAAEDLTSGTLSFSQLPDTFTFSSGHGAWYTTIYLNDDGTFTGYYSDWDASGKYDGPTYYICEFSGKFSEPVQQSEYIYSTALEYLSIDSDGEIGDEYMVDDTLYVISFPYGMEDADEFLIYLPGTPFSDIDEGFLNLSNFSTEIRTTMPAGVYGLYNVSGERPFAGSDESSFWGHSYTYEYEETYCRLYPSYYSESDIAFFSGDGSGASILLYFDWTEDEYILTLAYDERGSGEYIIEITVDDDAAAAQVKVVSLEGNDLTAYGGSADGILQAEFIY